MIAARDNPFAVHRVLRERYRLDEHGWTALITALRRQGGRGLIVGPHGSGKTTLLEDLAARLAERGWRIRWARLHRESPQLTSATMDFDPSVVGPDDFVLLDGAELLRAATWWRFRWQTRRAGGLVITAHATGRLPTLWRCETSAALLQQIVASLGTSLSVVDAARLHRRHAGNIRDALRELYDQAARASPPGRTAPAPDPGFERGAQGVVPAR